MSFKLSSTDDAGAIFMSALYVAASCSDRICRRLKLCSHAKVRSTTHRVFPRPLPRGSPWRAMYEAMPVACSGLFYFS